MRRQTIAYSLLYVFLQIVAFPASANQWITVAPGIEYQDLNNNALTRWSHIHAFRIDLNKNKLELARASTFSRLSASVSTFARRNHALIAINGGFFDENYRPLGLRINQQQLYNPLKQISWWGVFYIKNQKASLIGPRQYTNKQQPDFAIQSGPRLIINGKIPSLRPGYAERSALGIDADGKVIMLVTENTPMTTTILAKLMQASPLDCHNALNLDGGSSSQLYAHIGALQIDHRGYANVHDAVIVKPQ